MASSSAAAQLTEAHRLAQVRLGRATVVQLLAVWRVLDPRAIDRTAGAWLRVAVPLVATQRRVSAAVAAHYLTAFRELELGAGSFIPAVADTIDARQVTAALTINGPVRLKAATARGELLTRAAQVAQVETARAGMRYALDGGRDTILDSVRGDRSALGWSRATSGSPCAFCAMLASRGPSYGSEDTAGFEAHAGCQCVAEPVYREDTAWPSGARELRDRWDETTAGLSGTDAINAFRRALDS